ncbi:MAG TPA: tryptophan 2,3-dioxygenase family protein [Micromonosporaceae bacterium]
MDNQSPVEQARDLLTRPVFNPVLDVAVGEGKLDYELYLRTNELLSLQIAPDELALPDELMFQIVHQAQEIWLKLLAHELAELVGDLDDERLWDAATRLTRAVRIVHCLAEEIRVLETLTPDSYQVIRRHLGNGSGQQSPGYNRVSAVARLVRDALTRLLARRDIELIRIYQDSAVDSDLKRLCESLLDLDEGYQTWLFTHYMLVRRTIGVQRDVAALDGVPTQVLVGRMTQPLFRDLWQVRARLTATWTRAGGTSPGTPRREGMAT